MRRRSQLRKHTTLHPTARSAHHPKNSRVAAGDREKLQSEAVPAYNGNPFLRFCVQWKSLYPYCVQWKSFYLYCVQWKSLYPVLRAMEIPIRIAYNDVQWKSLYPLLRTIEIPISVSSYNGNPYIRYCVQLNCY